MIKFDIKYNYMINNKKGHNLCVILIMPKARSRVATQ